MGVDVVRIGNVLLSWESCAFKVDGQPVTNIVALDWSQRRDVKIIPSQFQDRPGLGMSAGAYGVKGFTLRMLHDAAYAFKQYLAGLGDGSYGTPTFTFQSQVNEPNIPAITKTASLCKIKGERDAREEGIDELVVEFDIGCMRIVDGNIQLDGLTSTALVSDGSGFPASDSITIAKTLFPGKWTLLEAPKVFGWDVRKGYALSGATVVPSGDELVLAKFLAEFWSSADFQAFRLLRRKYLKKAVVNVSGMILGAAIGIDHPELKDLGVSDVVVKEITPCTNDGTGIWSCHVSFLQYRAPILASAKPDFAIPAEMQPAPSAADNAQRETQNLSNTLAGLAP